MDDPTPADQNAPDDQDVPEDREEVRTDRRAALVIVATLVLAAVVAFVVWLVTDDEDEPAVTTTTATSEAPGTSSTAPTSTESTFAPSLDDELLASVVWPDVGSSRRFDDPAAAAHAFATEYLGFVDPQVGASSPGADPTATVEVRPTADGPVTTVELSRSADDGTWWVTGASTPSIEVTSPAAGDTVASPLQPVGRSRAFEGTVEVEVRVDGGDEPAGAGFVTGGAGEELADFSGEVDFDPSGASRGAVVFRTTSAEDGRTWEATVVRVAFSEG